MKLTKQALIISLSIILFSIAVASAQAQTDDNGSDGEGVFELHCSIGVIGFLVVTAALAAGFLVSGRFGRISGFKPLPVHKLVVVAMAAYLTGVFIFGLVIRNIVFVESMHGVFGFSVVILAWVTASLNPLMMSKVLKWKRASKIHLVFATALFIVIAIHLSYAITVLG